jgi:hypothetical protein
MTGFLREAEIRMLPTSASNDAVSDTTDCPLDGDEKRVLCEYIHPMLPVLSLSTLSDLSSSEGNCQSIIALRLAVKAATTTYTAGHKPSLGCYNDRKHRIDSLYQKADVRYARMEWNTAAD